MLVLVESSMYSVLRCVYMLHCIYKYYRYFNIYKIKLYN